MHRTRILSLIAAGMLLGLVAPGTAMAVTFGADLGAPSGNTASCDTGGFSSSSCTFFSTAAGPSFFAPQSGTVTAVRVRTGPGPQGPMQVVVLSQLLQNKAGDPGHPYTACCFVEAYGPVFTPASNTVTTVPVSLPMTEQAPPAPDDYTSNSRADFLALSVLEPGVAIPATTDSQSGYVVFAPAPDPASTPAPSPSPYAPRQSSDGFGFHLALSADESPTTDSAPVPPPATNPAPGGTTPTTPGTNPTPLAAVPAVAFAGPHRLRVHRGAVTLPLTCARSAACVGRVALQSAATPRLARERVRSAAARTQRPVTYGTARFRLAAGRRGRVRISLTRAGRAALRGRHRLKAYVNVAFSTSRGRAAAFAVTLVP